MFDPYIRPLIEGPLTHIGKRLATKGITANTATLLGFANGLIAIALICGEYYLTGLFFICLNRLFDGIDGAIARESQLSDFGGFLDIVCDFIIYSGVIFAFGIADPNRLLGAAFLIFSFIGPMSSFLAYAIFAAKNNRESTRRGKKSFYYLGGLCEGTETSFLLLFLCLFPEHFTIAAVIFGALCWLTTLGRIYLARSHFGT